MKLDRTVAPFNIIQWGPLIMNRARPQTWPQNSPKPPQIRLETQHNDQHGLKPNQCLHDLKNLQSKLCGDEIGVVIDDDSAGLGLCGITIPFTQRFTELVTDVVDFRVAMSGSKVLPVERAEVDVVLYVC